VQEYNFIQLINEANKHLKKLAPRYTLDFEKRTFRRDVFELYVIDNDMAGERRSVRTLSGGESFLISLALALALSSMASFKISLYNLFIDEGFGSLDAQTLDMALSTLERLQSQTNRQIGIISHVEALKERIPVKISVQKLTGGTSKISISSQ
jgi:exonuclease SbcC